MNYQPVTAGNQTNKNAGPQETNGNTGLKKNVDAGQSEEKNVSTQQYIVFPLWSSISSSNKSSDETDEDDTTDDAAGEKPVQKPASENEQALKNVLDKMMDQEKEAKEQSDAVRKEFEAQCNRQNLSGKTTRASSTNSFNTVSTPVNTAGASRIFGDVGSSFVPLSKFTNLPHDPLMPDLEDTAEVPNTGIFGSAYDDDDLDTCNSPYADQVVGAKADFNNMEPSIVQEPTKIAQALDDESWVEAMQEELLQFKIQKMNIKSAFLYGTIEEEDKYVGEILKKFGFSSIRTTSTPMETNKALAKDEEGEDVDVHLYRYLKGRPKLGLWYPKDSPFILEAFSDSDYAGASLDRKSTTGGCQFLGSRRKQRKDIEVSQSSASTKPMTEKETNKESVPKHSYDPSQSGEDRMQLHELMNLCTKLSDRVLALETTKTTQALEIASLKSRVKKLEKKASKRTHKLDDKEMFDTYALIGDEVFAENDMTKKEHDVIPKEVSVAEILTTVGIKILVSIAAISTAAPSTILVSPPVITESTVTTAPSTILKAKGITFRDAGETTTRTPTSVSSSSIKDKGKAKMDEPEVPLNKKDQIRLDEELARRLDAKEQETARPERENEQKQGELTIEENSKKIMELMNERKRHFAKLRAEEKRRKPLIKGKRRNQMCTYLKNIRGFTHNQLKNKSYEEIQTDFDKTIGWINNFKPLDFEEVKSSKKKAEGSKKKLIGKKRAGNEQKQESSKRQRIEDDKETNEHEEPEEDDESEMKKHMEIVQDKEEIAIDAIPLATKPPMIVEYKIVKKGQKGFYHLIRADGSSKRYSSMIKMFQNIDREDLETLWKLVKAKHRNTRLEDDYERVFLGDLKVMFEPDIKSEVWRSLQG
ncbi:hypothetical protein Tco_1394104 [Tanacetum coccineum]